MVHYAKIIYQFNFNDFPQLWYKKHKKNLKFNEKKAIFPFIKKIVLY